MSYDLCLHVDANDPAVLAFAFVNARNYLNGLPGKEFELVMVANGPAVKLFVPAQTELQKTAEELMARGLKLRLCKNALDANKMTAADLWPGCEVVPAGLVEIVELPEQKLPESPAPAEIEQALAREAALIEEKLPKGGAVIALCIEGTELSSEALSKKLAQLASAGASQLTFLIGGSFGLHPRVKQRADLRLSMSPMTFPHHLARVMLLEQLYRAYQIDTGTRYHK